MTAKRKTADWLSLGEASRVLGIDPDTLRRWADAGKIEVFVTPGGHRRFSRGAVDAMLPRAPRGRDQIDERPERVTADLGRHLRAELGVTGWSRKLGDAERETFRERGRAASTLIVRYLNARRKADRQRLLFEVDDLGRAYGRDAKAGGLSLAHAAEVLLLVRARFLEHLADVARTKNLGARSATLFEDADRALDRMLLAMIEAHQSKR